jgi:hypothetical protein
MKVENAVYPKPEQMQALAEQKTEGPLVMVNQTTSLELKRMCATATR